MANVPKGPVAAIDCGTNSTRLLVVDPAGTSLVRDMRVTRLGQGVDETRKLDLDAIERTVAVLTAFRRTMDDSGVVGGRLVATSAVRDADNGDDFLAAAEEAVGLEAELLSGQEEGRLAYAGATVGLSPSPAIDVVVDIGGGSTELAVGAGVDVDAVSLDVGCVRLTERYLRHDPPTPAEADAAMRAIEANLGEAASVLPRLADFGPGGRLIGLAGTVSTLAALDQGLDHYDRARIHHSVLTREAVDRWCAVLIGEPAAARGTRSTTMAGRQDVIVGGALVLRQVMAMLGDPDCLVSESDILDGLAESVRVIG
jgi:exopolyphosphatase / guanosine-5'-triphosphate,3'-diphosphate pyrophosphatase